MAIDGLDLISPAHYGSAGPPHPQWRDLRSQPLTHFAPEGFEPFWAVTRHADITEISSRPEDFCNGKGIVLLTEEQAYRRDNPEIPMIMKTIIEMDPPDHRIFRKVASGYFTPRGIERLDEIVTESARIVIDSLGSEGEADFVEKVTQQHPLRVLSTILGIAPDQEQQLLQLPTQLFGQVMAEQASGSIINISSMAAQRPLTRVIGYAAAKAAIDNLTKWLSVDLAQKYGAGLRINAIAPGFFIGDQNRAFLLNEDGSLTQRGQLIIEHTPLGRFGEPDELVGTAVWLASDAARFVTGIVVPVDGGFSASSGI